MRVTTRTARLHFYFSVISLFVAQPRLSGQIKCPDGCRPGQWSKSASGIASKSVKSVEQDRDLRIYSRDGRMCVRVLNREVLRQGFPYPVSLFDRLFFLVQRIFILRPRRTVQSLWPRLSASGPHQIGRAGSQIEMPKCSLANTAVTFSWAIYRRHEPTGFRWISCSGKRV
jgi:hypothetical protein